MNFPYVMLLITFIAITMFLPLPHFVEVQKTLLPHNIMMTITTLRKGSKDIVASQHNDDHYHTS
jgi:hypothetical protein